MTYKTPYNSITLYSLASVLRPQSQVELNGTKIWVDLLTIEPHLSLKLRMPAILSKCDKFTHCFFPTATEVLVPIYLFIPFWPRRTVWKAWSSHLWLRENPPHFAPASMVSKPLSAPWINGCIPFLFSHIRTGAKSPPSFAGCCRHLEMAVVLLLC